MPYRRKGLVARTKRATCDFGGWKWGQETLGNFCSIVLCLRICLVRTYDCVFVAMTFEKLHFDEAVDLRNTTRSPDRP